MREHQRLSAQKLSQSILWFRNLLGLLRLLDLLQIDHHLSQVLWHLGLHCHHLHWIHRNVVLLVLVVVVVVPTAVATSVHHLPVDWILE